MIKRRILVVDNDLDICHTIAVHMQTESTDICCMPSASEALDSIMRVDYCLVILSNQLPGINSIEIIRIMRLTQYIPIIVLTSPLSPNDKAALLQAGADAIIDKPLDTNLCAAQANALIQLYANLDRGHSKIPKEQVSFGTDLVIFPHFRQVLVDGKTLSLTRKEFELLLHFARHPRRVFSREQLYAAI